MQAPLSACLARVVSDMSVVENCFAEYGETPDQSLIQSEGNQYLRQKAPLVMGCTFAMGL